MKTKAYIALVALAMSSSLNAAVTLIGLNNSTTATTWVTDGLTSEGGINYQNSVVGNFIFISSGGQSQTVISVEWPDAGTIDTTMGQAGGGTLRWTGTPSVGDTLVWQGIAPVSGVFAIVNTADINNTSIVAANKISLTSGQVASWVDDDPTTNELYSFIQVDDALNINNGGNVGAWAAAIVAVPEPSSTALLGLGGLALLMRRKR